MRSAFNLLSHVITEAKKFNILLPNYSYDFYYMKNHLKKLKESCCSTAIISENPHRIKRSYYKFHISLCVMYLKINGFIVQKGDVRLKDGDSELFSWEWTKPLFMPLHLLHAFSSRWPSERKASAQTRCVVACSAYKCRTSQQRPCTCVYSHHDTRAWHAVYAHARSHTSTRMHPAVPSILLQSSWVVGEQADTHQHTPAPSLPSDWCTDHLICT